MGERNRDGFMVMNIIMIILGLGSLGIGIWMNAEEDVKAYLFVFGANPNGNWLVGATGLFIASGIITIGVAVMGIVGSKNRVLLTVYCMLVILIMLLELIAGFLALAFREELYDIAMTNMQNQVKNHYEWDNKVGLAWNRVQVRRRCCGANSAEDFRCSEWWYSQSENSGYGCPNNYYNAEKHVPKTCCVLEMNQDLDPENVDPQNPIPKNEERCNEDAAGNMWAGSSNVHGRGCFTALQDLLFTHVYILLGVGIGIGLIQIISLVMGLLTKKHLYKEDD